MPAAEWINHGLTITGPEYQLQLLRGLVGGPASGDAVFNPRRFCPEPLELESHARAGTISQRLLTWRMTHWGTTKVAESSLLTGPGRLVYSFRSPSSPINRELLRCLAELAPECRFILEFHGNEYSGSASAERGRILDYRDSYDSSDDDDTNYDDDEYADSNESGSDDPTE